MPEKEELRIEAVISDKKAQDEAVALGDNLLAELLLRFWRQEQDKRDKRSKKTKNKS